MSLSKSNREHGFSLIEMIVVVAILGILVSIVVPALLKAVDRSRQRRSMADMHTVASVNAAYAVDNMRFVNVLTDLEPLYILDAPALDAWGTAYQYVPGANNLTYVLSSLGSDAAVGPAAPSPWYDEPFNADIILDTGRFTQAPAGQ